MEELNVPRVLFLLPFAPPGALALLIARKLRERGLITGVLSCQTTHPDYQLDPLDDFQAVGCRYTIEDYERGDPTRATFRVINDFRPHVILQIGASELYSALPRVKERFEEIALIDCLYNQVGHVVNHFLFQNIFDATIVESSAMKKFIRTQSSSDDRVIIVINSGVDVKKFVPLPTTLPPRADQAITVGYLGRLSSEKNPFGFVEIAEIFTRNNDCHNVHFALYGQGPLSEQVRARCEASLAKNLTYYGYAPDQHDTLRSFDLLVVPSALDGRPVTIMEATASGVPVIASAVGGIPEMITEDVNGFTFEKGNFGQAARIIQNLAGDPNALDALRQRSRDFALTHFSLDSMIDRYISAVEIYAPIVRTQLL